mgnify:CR=1 FL=1
MNKNKKKLFSLIDKEIPDKDLFERIQNNFEVEKVIKRKMTGFPIIYGLSFFLFQDFSINA